MFIHIKRLYNLSDSQVTCLISMALQLQLQLPACNIGRMKSITCPPRARKATTFATLSQPRSDNVNWVEATSSFFDQDKRPIMLFDGKIII